MGNETASSKLIASELISPRKSKEQLLRWFTVMFTAASVIERNTSSDFYGIEETFGRNSSAVFVFLPIKFLRFPRRMSVRNKKEALLMKYRFFTSLLLRLEQIVAL